MAPTPSTWPCVRALTDESCVLAVAVTPNARATEVVGLHDDALRLKLAAPPVDGKANAALTAWLASELGLPKRAVRLRRGETARHKQVEIDAPQAAVQAWLNARLPGGVR
ncbi:MAG: DUF167 domain-containing protein [Burkholderiaceae bacterium]